ncbi:MAG: hypothetical protein EOP40_10225 [Rubrivivax sp.]|nr:MAG: hypothetical protein EOP40_10225 [Rubrivivax sp.]
MDAHPNTYQQKATFRNAARNGTGDFQSCMLITTSIALAGALHVVDTCRWNKPGTNRYMGNVVASVDHYADIPPAIRERLKARMAEHQYDDVVTITRDAIQGEREYAPGITDMHFGENRVCREVTRKRWHPDRQHKGLVYCEQGHCLMLPTVCGNLSRIQPVRSDEPLDIEPAAGPPPATPEATPAAAGAMPTDFDALPPTAAGSPEQPAAVPVGVPPSSPFWPYNPFFPPGVPLYPPYIWVPPPGYPPTVMPGVPEPAQWLQMLAGAAVLAGWWSRRRHARRMAL